MPTASDPDGDALTAVLITDAAHGTLALNSGGSFVYQPDPDFNGGDGFTYSVDDGRARFTPHGAFRLPDEDPGAPPRQSIESRTYLVFE